MLNAFMAFPPVERHDRVAVSPSTSIRSHAVRVAYVSNAVVERPRARAIGTAAPITS
jgi:hypothetical protein